MEISNGLLHCKICKGDIQFLFTKMILSKFEIKYFRCTSCEFLQTETPFWLDEAYSSGAISALDTGVISRNIDLRNRTKEILLNIFSDFSTFKGLDYGGGEGILVRMLRDLGFDFYRYDLHAKNSYARYFDLKDLPVETKFNILTAFEVFEHLEDPIGEIHKMFEYTDVILFSTELQPPGFAKDLVDWWYLVPEGGQHISFYSFKTLEIIAGKFNSKLYSNNKSLHVLSKNFKLKNPFDLPTQKGYNKTNYFHKIFSRLIKNYPSIKQNKKQLTSLTYQDFEMVRRKIINNED